MSTEICNTKLKFAAVDAYDRKLEIIEIRNIFCGRQGKKKSFLPKHAEDFDYHGHYTEMFQKCEDSCRANHAHRKYRPVNIRFLGGETSFIKPLCP